jgi:acyl-CoA synthetase (AMP-forming)/AMP-acid ligase II
MQRNVVNNARFVGEGMQLSPKDITCCSPPLFHCFGLVMGFLASLCHGSTVIFPSDSFHAAQSLQSIFSEKATILMGVPTMFLAEINIIKKTRRRPTTLRTGLAAGNSITPTMMDELQKNMGVDKMLIAYGMTETSPVTFLSSLDDPRNKRITTVGREMPHTAAKVIDRDGNSLERSARRTLHEWIRPAARILAKPGEDGRERYGLDVHGRRRWVRPYHRQNQRHDHPG